MRDSPTLSATSAPGFRAAISTLTLALAVTLFVVWTGRGPADTPLGCSAEGACSAVVKSHWAWFGPLPLSTVGLGGYAGTLLVLGLLTTQQLPKAWETGAHAVAWWAITGGLVFSLWLIGLQHFVIHHYCLYCMSAHLFGIIGFTLAARALFRRLPTKQRRWFAATAPVSPALLIGLHLLLPVNLVRVADAETSPDQPAYQGSGLRLGKPQKSRTASFLKGELQLDTHQVPVRGNPDAPLVVIKLFDYSCPACRGLEGVLEKWVQQSGKELCVVTYPVPMHPDCNPNVKKFHSGFQYSCELTRLALAAWVVDRAKFGSYHTWLIGQGKTVSPKAARKKADELFGNEAMERALTDPRVEQTLRDGIALHDYIGAKSIPVLLIGDQVVEYGGGSPKPIYALLDAAAAKK